MSFENFETVVYSVGGRSAVINIVGNIISKCSKVLFNRSSVSNRKNAMTVSDNPVAAEGLGDFCMSQGKKGLNVLKKKFKECFIKFREGFGDLCQRW